MRVSAPAGASTASAYGVSTLSTAANLSTSSTTAVEVDPSLRVTVRVPKSGKVLVRQWMPCQKNNGNSSMHLAVQVDGTGPWTNVGGMASAYINLNKLAYGEVELTGLTQGSHTFYMGWFVNGGTVSCPANSYGGVANGTRQSVVTLPDSPFPSYVKSNLGSSVATSTTSTTPVELDASLRCTLVVPSSGKVLISQSFTGGAGNPAFVRTWVRVDGAGAWTPVGACINDNGGGGTGGPELGNGETVLTGLTPGSHTFNMGWSTGAAHTATTDATEPHYGDVVALTTFQSALALP